MSSTPPGRVVDSKNIRVPYSFLFNKPNNKKISKAINKWGKKGYEFAGRQDHDVGCLTMVLSFFWARGHSDLTFIKRG